MDWGKSILWGTLYTILGFGIAFLFLQITSYLFFDMTGSSFLTIVIDGRILVQQSYSALGNNNIIAKLLSDKIYYSIIGVVVLLIWGSNIKKQLNKEEVQNA